MAKIQTRRSISVSGRTYDKLQEYCHLRGETCSGVVEDLLTQLLNPDQPLRPTVTGRVSTKNENIENVPRSKFNTGSKPPEMDEDTKNARKVAAERVFTF